MGLHPAARACAAQVTFSNAHLALQQARQVFNDGNASYTGAPKRHLHVVFLSDFSLRSNSLNICDERDRAYEACLNRTGACMHAPTSRKPLKPRQPG